MPIPQRTLQIQALKAISSFKIGQEVRLEEIHDAGTPQNQEDPEGLDLMAEVSTSCSGGLPLSGRVLNALVTDWVDANRAMLEALFEQPLKAYLASNYPEIDIADLRSMEGLVWEDQIDYLAGFDEASGRLFFSVELVLDLE